MKTGYARKTKLSHCFGPAITTHRWFLGRVAKISVMQLADVSMVAVLVVGGGRFNGRYAHESYRESQTRIVIWA